MQDDPLVKIGRTIFRARTDLGMSQKAVSEKANIHCNTFAYIEGGINGASFLKVARICLVLGISLDQLMKDIDD